MKLFVVTVILSIVYACVQADVSHLLHNEQHHVSTTPQAGPAHPYVFSYEAGRAPGHIDRQHTEVSDGSGVIRGSFSYVDPRNEVRSVQYVADEHGFHPQLSHQLEDSEAVKRAKAKNFELYNRIAEEHANPELAPSNTGPRNTAAVVKAANKHLNLFASIAAEHAAIGAQQEADRKALEAASPHQHAQDQHQHF